MENKKRIAIIGSTGSIGTQALDVIEENPNNFEAEVLVAHSNADLLIAQAIKFNPNAVIIGGTAYAELQKDMFDAGAKFVLIKPFSIESIEQIIEKYILKKRPKTGYYK